MGSGKTTLARALSSNMGWNYLPESPLGLKYLNDLFDNPKRWAFETQISFLCQKAIEIKEMTNRYDFILDRSFYEDIYIFAEYFYRNGYINDRSYENYKILADHFILELPNPDLIIYCDCPLDIIKKRIATRGRDFQKLYPPNHLDDINELYNKWINSYKLGPFYRINSEVVDFRNSTIQKSILEEILIILRRSVSIPEQINLFENSVEEEKIKILSPIYAAKEKTAGERKYPEIIKSESKKTEAKTYPLAYIAAPFTAVAIEKESDKEEILIKASSAHGKILRGEYRTMLNEIGNKLNKVGIDNILPHRDVNKWGNKELTSKEVVEKCTAHVAACDLFISILGESHGSHYEFGLAYSLKKPCIIIKCKEIKNSFIAEGINNQMKNILIIECSTIKEIPNYILIPTTIKFIEKYIPLTKVEDGITHKKI